jgi:hypothetical protein
MVFWKKRSICTNIQDMRLVSVMCADLIKLSMVSRRLLVLGIFD